MPVVTGTARKPIWLHDQAVEAPKSQEAKSTAEVP
jgi:hypothetical protein